jgi:hypothetical protein
MDLPLIERWLSIEERTETEPLYRHSWCKQREAGQWQSVLAPLVSYFEGAHRDARRIFQRAFGIDLNPLRRSRPEYPRNMPAPAKRGFFGEVLCGLFVESIQLVGAERWTVPAFLFRYHNDAELYLIRLMNGAPKLASIKGRTGNDFLALNLDANGRISKYLVGEAKCYEVFNVTKCGEFLKELSEERGIPCSLPQLQRILENIDPDKYANTIDHIDEICERGVADIPRSDIFVYVFDDPKSKNYESMRITKAMKESNYTATRPLQVFEVHIPDGADLIETLYSMLYQGVTDVAV